MRLQTFAVVLSLALVWGTRAKAAELVYQFGKDRLAFPGTARPVLDESEQQYDIRLGHLRRIDTGALSPCEGVTVYRKMMTDEAVVDAGGRGVRLSFENVGQYFQPVRDSGQVVALLTLIDKGFGHYRVAFPGFLAITAAAKSEALPFRVSPEAAAVEGDTIEQGVLERDGVWLAHFLVIEGASLVEYKYAITKDNSIARLRRVVVEGPAKPEEAQGGGNPMDVDRWPARAQEAFQVWGQCREFLWSHRFQ